MNKANLKFLAHNSVLYVTSISSTLDRRYIFNEVFLDEQIKQGKAICLFAQQPRGFWQVVFSICFY